MKQLLIALFAFMVTTSAFAERVTLLCRAPIRYIISEIYGVRDFHANAVQFELTLYYTKAAKAYPFGRGLPQGWCASATGGPLPGTGAGMLIETLTQDNLRRDGTVNSTIIKNFDPKTKEYSYNFGSLLKPLFENPGLLYQIQLDRIGNLPNSYRLDYDHPRPIRYIVE